MKLSGCVTLFTLAILLCSASGTVEARGAHHDKARAHDAARPAHGSSWPGRGHAAAWPSQGHDGGWRGAGHDFAWHRGGLSVAWAAHGRLRHGGYAGRFARHHGYSGGGGLQCVTFARADSGIELTGNASAWWTNAEGLYQRGVTPEPGSVLNFRANGAMRMGHVAVVSEVVNGRTVVIDHANWGGPGAVRGGVSRNISVVDVSPSNDWSAVRVALGHSGEFGSIYPTYGFIYNRPDGGAVLASNDGGVEPVPALNPAPRDPRPREQVYDEVAEAPEGPAPSYRHGAHRRHRVTLGSHHHGRHHES